MKIGPPKEIRWQRSSPPSTAASDNAAFFLSQIYRPWGLVAHRGWARLVLDHRCFVEVPKAPRHRAERAHAEADYNEETARGSYFNPPAGHCQGQGLLFSEARKPCAEAAGHGRRGWCARVKITTRVEFGS